MIKKKNLILISLIPFFIFLFFISFHSTGWTEIPYPLSISSVVPDSYINTSPVEVTIHGSGFSQNPEVYLYGGGPYKAGECITGGLAEDIAISGSYAYVVNGDGLRLIDITDPVNPKITGSVNTPGYAYKVVINGNYAFVIDKESALQVIDISDPSLPKLKGECSIQGITTELIISGNYAWIAYFILGSENNHGLQIIDIHNPAKPIGIRIYKTNYIVEGIAIRNNYAYLTGSGGLKVLDITDPVNPEEIEDNDSQDMDPVQLLLEFFNKGIIIRGRYAYMIGALQNGLGVIDLADPIHPKLIGYCDTFMLSTEEIMIYGDYAYLISSFEGFFWIIDIADPVHPACAGGYNLQSIMDGNQEEPSEGPFRLAVNDNYAFITTGLHGVMVIDIRNITNPAFISSFETSSLTSGIATSGNYAFVTNSKGLQVIDITDPVHPDLAGSFSTSRWAREVVIRGDYAYLTDMRNFHVIDITDPTDPKSLGKYETPDWTRGIAVSGNYAYVTLDNKIVVIDITNPNLPVRIGGYNPSYYVGSPVWIYGLAVKGNYAYVIEGNKGLEIIDISDPANPTRVKSYTIAGWAYAIAINGNYAYVANSNGFQVLNIGDPENPIYVGSYEKFYPGEKITISNNYAYLSGTSGLHIVDISDLTNPWHLGTYNTPGFANGVAVSGSYAYLIAEKELLVLHAFPTYCTPVTYINSNTLKTTIPSMLNPGIYNIIIKDPNAAIGILHNGFQSICIDCDNDGFTEAEGDCDDNNAVIYPGAPELCDGKDNNCDQNIPANELDDDQDGFRICEGDCNDEDPAIYSGAPEFCDGKDNDCDQNIPVSEMDIDEDGYSVCGGDCDDQNDQINPGKEEILCNSLNDDCDPNNLDCPLQIISIAPDSYINSSPIEATIHGSGFMPESEVHLYIDMNNNITNPIPLPTSYIDPFTLYATIPAFIPIGAYNVMITNPDSSTETLVNGFQSFCLDCDNDGHSEVEGDCDDYNAAVFPDAPELCDGVDNNCDLIIPENELDVDQDGFMGCEGDCDDQDAAIYPYAPELCDGKDNNCDQNVPLTELDTDQDGYRKCEGDCDDQDAGINPGKEEILYNEKDDDCNPATIDWPVKIASVTPNSYINSSPVEAIIKGSGFNPDSKVHLSGGGAFEVGIWNTLDNVYYVTINGDYAYVAVLENGLKVIDISDPANPEIIGGYDVQPAIIKDIAIEGNYAYVANQHNGLLVIDISNPSQPIYAGAYDTPGVAMGVALNGNYAYVADGNKGLQVLDITDPAYPEFAGSFEALSTYIYSVSVKDGYAYVLSQGLEIFDISDPTQPLHIGSLNLGGRNGEIIVRDDYVYVSGEGLISIDVSDPENPRIAGSYKSCANPYFPFGNYTYEIFWGLDISGNYAYLTGNKLQMIDISDPANLRWIGSYNITGEILSIDVMGNYAYIADWENGLLIIDIFGLADPSLAGSYDIWGQITDGGYPVNGPYYVSYPTANTSYDLTISGNYAYAIYSSCYQTAPPSQIFDSYTLVKSLHQELRVIDITDPINPRVLGSYESTMEEIEYSSTPFSLMYNWIKTGVSALVVSEGYAYMANGIGLRVIDICDPNRPILVGNYNSPGKGISDIITSNTGSGIAVSGNYAYMVNDEGLQIINITDPNHPVLTGSYATQGDLFIHTPLPGEACGVAVDGIYAYISNGRGFHIIDISDPADPRLVCKKQEILCNNSLDNVLREGLPCKLALSGSFVYLANWDRGVNVIDISDPNSPVCIGGYDTPGLACRITLNNTYAYVADGEAGVQVIDVANPENPELIRGYSTPSYACGIATNNDYAYLADMSTMLLVIKIDPMTPAFANYTCTEISFIDFSTLSVIIPALLPGGAYNVRVENPDGKTGTLPNGFYSICADCDNDGYTEAEGDCDDYNSAIYPGAPELCDGKDNDCDQIIPTNERDEDQDGYRVCNGDCEDQDITIYPGALEMCDGKDNNCDQNIPVTELDSDQDGYRVCEGDCDDQDGLINPSQAEISCNGKNDDCDPNTSDCTLQIISIVPDSYINTSPTEATIHGLGFTPESEVFLCGKSSQYNSMSMAYYSFSEGEGTKTTDMSGNGNNGTIYGTTWTNGKFGDCLEFDGNDDYVDVPNFPKMGANQVSLEAWVNFRGKRRYACIVDKGCNDMENFYIYCGEWNTQVNFGLCFNDGSKHASGLSPAVSTGEWHHYVGTWNGSHIKLYLDGNLVSTSADYSGLIMKDTIHSLTIGKRNWPNPPYYEHFWGRIDEVHIYNRALNAEEVVNRYHSSSIPDLTTCCISPSISFIDYSTLHVNIPALLTPGTYDVIVKNPDGAIEILQNGFLSECIDCDSDGYTEAEGDCNDQDADIYPGAPELCDGKDNDCDQIIPINELDEDQDEYRACEGDPDDLDAAVYPGAPELCDGKDNNVDGEIDEENAEGCITYYKDADEDGYGVDEDNRCLCVPEGNYTASQGGDQDDLDPDVPGTIIEPCLFTAKITALKQVENGFWDTSTVYIGLDTNAASWPSPGPVPEYTVHMTISEDLLYDYRQTGSDYEEWNLVVRVLNSEDPNREGSFPLLSWDPDELCPPGIDAGYLRLYSEDAQGRRTLLVDDMYQNIRYLTKEEDGQYVFALDMYVFSYYIVWSKEIPIEMNISAGWNMISLPVIPYDAKISDLFPDAIVAYGYEERFGYVRVKENENMEVGEGYWILFHEDQNYTLTGQPIHSYKKTLYKDGWEMIGGCTSPAQPSTAACNIDVIYRYVPGIGYQRVLESEYIDSGKGYWILYSNITDHCDLMLETIGY